MTTTALVIMICAWAVILFLTVRFFVKVLTTPPKPDGDSYGTPKDA